MAAVWRKLSGLDRKSALVMLATMGFLMIGWCVRAYRSAQVEWNMFYQVDNFKCRGEFDYSAKAFEALGVDSTAFIVMRYEGHDGRIIEPGMANLWRLTSSEQYELYDDFVHFEDTYRSVPLLGKVVLHRRVSRSPRMTTSAQCYEFMDDDEIHAARDRYRRGDRRLEAVGPFHGRPLF